MVQKIDERALYFSRRLRQRISTVRKIILFGSRARGDAHEGSDYDFAVILDKKDKSAVSTVREVEVEFLDRYDTLSSSLVYDQQEWERRKNLPIGLNIEQEGVQL